jgi:hypothetical protein
MPEAALAVFGGWVLASLIAGSLIVTVRSWLKSRQVRSQGQQAEMQMIDTRPAGRNRELQLVTGDKRRHARR